MGLFLYPITLLRTDRLTASLYCPWTGRPEGLSGVIVPSLGRGGQPYRHGEKLVITANVRHKLPGSCCLNAEYFPHQQEGLLWVW